MGTRVKVGFFRPMAPLLLFLGIPVFSSKGHRAIGPHAAGGGLQGYDQRARRRRRRPKGAVAAEGGPNGAKPKGQQPPKAAKKT